MIAEKIAQEKIKTHMCAKGSRTFFLRESSVSCRPEDVNEILKTFLTLSLCQLYQEF
jgi:hypothetical protein